MVALHTLSHHAGSSCDNNLVLLYNYLHVPYVVDYLVLVTLLFFTFYLFSLLCTDAFSHLPMQTHDKERISTNDLFVWLGGKSEMIRQLTMLKETIVPSPSSSSASTPSSSSSSSRWIDHDEEWKQFAAGFKYASDKGKCIMVAYSLSCYLSYQLMSSPTLLSCILVVERLKKHTTTHVLTDQEEEEEPEMQVLPEKPKAKLTLREQCRR